MMMVQDSIRLFFVFFLLLSAASCQVVFDGFYLSTIQVIVHKDVDYNLQFQTPLFATTSLSTGPITVPLGGPCDLPKGSIKLMNGWIASAQADTTKPNSVIVTVQKKPTDQAIHTVPVVKKKYTDLEYPVHSDSQERIKFHTLDGKDILFYYDP